MVQNGTGRYGVQYDQTTVNRLYHDGLNDLLTQSLDTMASPQASSREAWERAVSQGSSWVYYDFLYNVSFTSQSSRGEGEARSFLITARNGRADALYYYNEETGDYYMAQLREASLVLPALLEDLVPNGGQFAFENSTLADTLAPYMMLLPQPPLCPVYTGANPLDDWDTADQEALLEALDFNPRASAVYEAVDGTVIQEGSYPADSEERENHLPRRGEWAGSVSGPLRPGKGPADQGGGDFGRGHSGTPGGRHDVLPIH